MALLQSLCMKFGIKVPREREQDTNWELQASQPVERALEGLGRAASATDLSMSTS